MDRASVRVPTGQSAARPTGQGGVISERLEPRMVLSGETDLAGLVLMDADKDVDLFALADGATLDVARLPQFTVRANAGSAVTTVQFGLDADPAYQVEIGAPFSIATEKRGDFRPWRPALGPHTITATPFYTVDGQTVAGVPMTINLVLYSTAPSKLVSNAVSYGRVDLTWRDNSSDETGFVVQRSTDGIWFKAVTTLFPNTTRYSDLSVSAGVKYTYRIAATTAGGRVLYSPTDWTLISTSAPAAPGAASAAAVSYRQVNLSWKDVANNEQGFVVERSLDGSTFSSLAVLGLQSTTYVDTSVAPNTTYYYRVGSYNPGGTTYAAALTARTFAIPPYALRVGAHNTGPVDRSILRAVDESILVTQDGTVIENLYVRGMITVAANNVTIRNVVIDATGLLYGIRCIDDVYSGTLIEDAEVANASSTGIYGLNFTARRLNIHHIGSDGLKAQGNVVVEDSWFHHLGTTAGAHADGVQISRGSGFVIRRNFFDIPIDVEGTSSNAAVFVKPDFGLIDNVLIDDNWMNGGNYTIAVDATNVVVRGNYFGSDYRFGALRTIGSILWEENYWADTGAPLLL
jgi:hypothetical protein